MTMFPSVGILNTNCDRCGLVAWDMKKHIEYSHPKIKVRCGDCEGNGVSSTIGYENGTMGIVWCTKCDGSGVYDSEERK